MSIAATLFPDGVPANLTQHGLVMSQAIRDSLIAKQDAAEITKHRVAPVALTDGRWALNADVLTEARENGLFDQFGLLDQDKLAQVEVLPWANVLALLPVPDEELL